MNSGGIARRLINLAKVIGSSLPGSLLHTTILANMMFGALSGSAVASAAALSGVMAPEIRKPGIDPSMRVPVSALLPAGYLPGILLGLVIMAVTSSAAYRRGYASQGWPTLGAVGRDFIGVLPPLGMAILVAG